MDFEQLRFDEAGLIPAIIQDEDSGTVLMMAYMNREALAKTIETRRCWFFSRSRGQLWQKGETSGNFQAVSDILYDCDADTLLLAVTPAGPACHTGHGSCFYRRLQSDDSGRAELKIGAKSVLSELFEVIQKRGLERPEGSYTARLWSSGLEGILAKVTEEAAEVVEAAKGEGRDRLIAEVADVTYHLLVLLAFSGVSLSDVGKELQSRRRPG